MGREDTFGLKYFKFEVTQVETQRQLEVGPVP